MKGTILLEGNEYIVDFKNLKDPDEAATIINYWVNEYYSSSYFDDYTFLWFIRHESGVDPNCFEIYTNSFFIDR